MKYLKWAAFAVVAAIAFIFFINLEENTKHTWAIIFSVGWAYWHLTESINEKHLQINRRLDYIQSQIDKLPTAS